MSGVAAPAGRQGELPPGLEIVMLPGWGSTARSMEALARELRTSHAVRAIELTDIAQACGTGSAAKRIAWLEERVPAGAVLLGWSLGGALAIEYARARPGKVAAAISIATSPCFVQRDGWSDAMAPQEFARFRREIAADSRAGLSRFAALQAHGDARPREVLRALQSSATQAGTETLLELLDLLAALDLRADLSALHCPALHVLGRHDALVSARVSAYYQLLDPDCSVWIAEQAAHAPQLSCPRALAVRIGQFLRDALCPAPGGQRDKAAVARSFGRAAPRYDQVAHLQRATGTELLERMPAMQPVMNALDLGSGTGYFAELLAKRFPQARTVGLDIAEAMLFEARAHHGAAINWLCGDAEQLPLGPSSLDLVFSNLVLQWCDALPAALGEIRRVLRPGGRALICTLAADTLWELRAAWGSVDARVHVNRFATVRDLRASAEAAGLVLRRCTQRPYVLHYSDVQSLARELRALGAHNVNRGRLEGLAGRGRWRALAEAYALFHVPAGLPASYQAVFLELERHDD